MNIEASLLTLTDVRAFAGVSPNLAFLCPLFGPPACSTSLHFHRLIEQLDVVLSISPAQISAPDSIYRILA